METQSVTIETLLGYLAQYGGAIVSTATLSPYDIEQARASGRMWVDSRSLGYVWMPRQGIPTTIEEVQNFDKWYPNDPLIPEETEQRVLESIYKLKWGETFINDAEPVAYPLGVPNCAICDPATASRTYAPTTPCNTICNACGNVTTYKKEEGGGYSEHHSKPYPIGHPLHFLNYKNVKL
jgi:hypothetical protein